MTDAEVGPVVGHAAVKVNAYTGAAVPAGTFGSTYPAWALTAARVRASTTLIPSPADPSNWADDTVGWGVILPEPPDLEPAALATADDAPEPIRELVTERTGKVLRYRASSQFGAFTLRDYAGGGDVLNAASPPGTGPKQLPMYLLIYGSPAEIPWHVQYTLNPVRNVGRLDLTGDGLANYVSALLRFWPGSAARYDAPVVWAVDHGGGDITTLMREAVAAEVYMRLAADRDITAGTYIDGSQMTATGQVLTSVLGTNRPSLVITTSHGMTGPLDDLKAMRDDLGLLVDQQHVPVTPDRLLDGWQPDGAIWFAQACCSAGSDSPSSYDGLFDADSLLNQVLTGVAKLGAMVSPLPRTLLGASKPLRAFIGQVEPTFNWTMSFPPNRQRLTSDLQRVLYERLCSGLPVGLAMSQYYQPIGSLLISHGQAISDYDTHAGSAATKALDLALYTKVTAYDRASTVILGDPTVAIPLPKPR